MIRQHFFRILGFFCLFGFFYLLIGAVAPFLKYEKVTDKTKTAFSKDHFYMEKAGPDRVQLLETNGSALSERLKLINQAKERIIISTFDTRDDESTKDLLALLLHKAEEGVKIRMVVDGFSSFAHMEGRELFYAFAAHPNAEIRIYNPLNLLKPWNTQGRMHDKYVIADHIGYILGGRNMFDYFIGEYPTSARSYDREVLVYNTKHQTQDAADSSLTQVENYFESIWTLPYCKPFHDDPALLEKEKVKTWTELLHQRYEKLLTDYADCFEKPDYLSNTVEAGKIQLISNPIHRYCKEPVVFYTLTELMKSAKKEVIVHSPYAVMNKYMYESLKEVTETVPVTLMINARENGDNFFGSSDYTFNKKKVLSTGVSLYEYSGGLSYHGKSLIIDDELAIIGSYNLDLRSTYLDTELMLSIQSPALAKELRGHMENFQADCIQVQADGTNIVPEHVTVASVPLWKKAAWNLVGFLMQPFRFLI